MILAPGQTAQGSRRPPQYGGTPLQNENGTYGYVPSPTGTKATGYQLQPPRTIMRPPIMRPPNGVVPPPPTGGVTPFQGRPAVLNAAPDLNPSLAGTSTTLPLPSSGPAAARSAAPAPAGAPAGVFSAPVAPPIAPAVTTAVTPAIAPPPLPAGAAPLTGAETPYSIGAGYSDKTNSALDTLQTEANRELAQPTTFDDPLAAQIKASQVAGINANYDVAQHHLDAALADRGINYSTIAGGDIMDLARARATDLNSVDAEIAAQRANDLAAGRRAAFDNATSVLGARAGLDASTRANQVGERSYVDSTRNTARDQSLQDQLLTEQSANQSDQSWQALLSRALGLSTANDGSNLLGGAADITNAAANRATGQQMNTEGGLGDLLRLFFTNQPAPVATGGR